MFWRFSVATPGMDRVPSQPRALNTMRTWPCRPPPLPPPAVTLWMQRAPELEVRLVCSHQIVVLGGLDSGRNPAPNFGISAIPSSSKSVTPEGGAEVASETSVMLKGSGGLGVR